MKLSRPLNIVHLYPNEMNLYGDTGNRLILEKRLAWRGMPYNVHLVSVGEDIPKNADIIIGGGGQDASQGQVEMDLRSKSSVLQTMADNGVVMLMICGMYQLLGRRFVTSDDIEIKGLGILPIETIAGQGRLIGNIVASSDDVGVLVGYENHSGRTYLDEGARPMAKVLKGKGNNDESREEGCRINNVFGTYMHGPILAKNPKFSDLLIILALQRLGVKDQLTELNDGMALIAQSLASQRPR